MSPTVEFPEYFYFQDNLTGEKVKAPSEDFGWEPIENEDGECEGIEVTGDVERYGTIGFRLFQDTSYPEQVSNYSEVITETSIVDTMNLVLSSKSESEIKMVI